MTALFGSGVMHAKFSVADGDAFYIGSANFGLPFCFLLAPRAPDGL